MTGGLDGRVKVWDVRTFKILHEYRLRQAVETMAVSQRGVLAMGFGTHVEVSFFSFSSFFFALFAMPSAQGSVLCFRFCSLLFLMVVLPPADVEGLLPGEGQGTLHDPSPGTGMWVPGRPFSAL